MTADEAEAKIRATFGDGVTRVRPKRRRAPTIGQLEAWDREGIYEATDGCEVEPDGTCPHGKESWLLVLGMI